MAKEKQKNGRLSQFWFVWNIIESIILFVGGVLAIVAGAIEQGGAEPSAPVEHAVAYVVASFVILDGLLRIVMHLAHYEKNDEATPMIIAGFEISLGVLFILLQAKYNSFTYMIINLVAIIMMVIGVLLLVYAIFFIAKKLAKLFMPILEILFSAVLVGIGITIEVLYNTESAKNRLVLILIGTILVVAAIAMFVIAIITHRKAKKGLTEDEDKKDAEPLEPEVVEPARKKITKKSKNAVVVVDEPADSNDESEGSEDEEPLQIENKD